MHTIAQLCFDTWARDYAVKLRNVALFVCIDDKHRIKVGEPGFALAAVERGRQSLSL